MFVTLQTAGAREVFVNANSIAYVAGNGNPPDKEHKEPSSTEIHFIGHIGSIPLIVNGAPSTVIRSIREQVRTR